MNNIEKKIKKLTNVLKPIHDALLIILIVIILLILLELGSTIVVKTFKATKVNSKLSLEIYNTTWARDYFIEFDESSEAQYYPYLGYRRKPYNGKYININNASIRLTTNPCLNLTTDTKRSPIKIFMFGGSTLWGTGSRDSHTIPSELSSLFCNSTFDFEITNFGESGFTNTQGIIALNLELQKGNIPDITIFYTGINDIFSAYQNNKAGLPQNILNRAREFNSRDKYNFIGAYLNGNFMIVLKQLFPSLKSTAKSKPFNLSLVKEILDVYTGNINIIESLSQYYDFQYIYYWQPTIYTKAILSPAEQKFDFNPSKELFDLSYEFIPLAFQHHPNFVNLADIFDTYPESIFIDEYHISEQGNEIVAGAIGDKIKNIAK